MVSAVQGRQAQLDAVRLLLRRGADPGTKNLENEQAAQLVPEGPMGDQVQKHYVVLNICYMYLCEGKETDFTESDPCFYLSFCRCVGP